MTVLLDSDLLVAACCDPKTLASAWQERYFKRGKHVNGFLVRFMRNLPPHLVVTKLDIFYEV